MDTGPQRVRGGPGLQRLDHGGDGRWHAAGADGDDIGTDDATAITGTARARSSPRPTRRSRRRTLTATDPDSSNAFVAQTNVAGERPRQVQHQHGRGGTHIDGQWPTTSCGGQDQRLDHGWRSWHAAGGDGRTGRDATVITQACELTGDQRGAVDGGTLTATAVPPTNDGGERKFKVIGRGGPTRWHGPHNEFVVQERLITVARADGQQVRGTATDDATGTGRTPRPTRRVRIRSDSSMRRGADQRGGGETATASSASTRPGCGRTRWDTAHKRVSWRARDYSDSITVATV